MNIETDSYSVLAASDNSTVSLNGTLRLQGREQYQPIYDLLMNSAAAAASVFEIDMQNLVFLNSSGISALSLFVIEMRKEGKSIRIRGNKSITWQTKSLFNFQRLYDAVEIIIR